MRKCEKMLKIYNSLTRKKEEFKPLKKGFVGMYVCGPTVYNPDHLGHARTWIFFDWLRRFLTEDYKVKYVQNITDVGHLVGDEEEGEDKIEKEAKKEGKTPEEIARFWEKEHFNDLISLNILKPDVSCRASEHVKEMISYIEDLIKNGHAYEVKGNVYFEVATFPDYGKLSGRKVDELISGARVKIDSKKRSPADFALWLKADQAHIQKWPSPWGDGYPGWHIECSVMSTKYLGQPFDIHGSANEHIFPHHENEIAQSEAYAGKPLARYFLHSGMLLIDGQKMAKSSGNFITVKDALKSFSADMIKLAFMTTHWRKPYNWSTTVFSEFKTLQDRLIRAKENAQPIKTGFKKEIRQALEDDFNTPKALAVIMANLAGLSREDFKYIESTFGLILKEEVKLTGKQEKMVKEREKARDKGNFKLSDEIREELSREGIALEDTPRGTRVTKNN